MRRLCLSLLLLAVLLPTALLLPACGREAPPPAASEVLAAMESAMDATVQNRPEGAVYHRALPPDAPAYLSDTLFSALYGEAARGLLTAEEGGTYRAVNDAALLLSVAPYPCELAVFRCSDTRAAATVAGLCRGRLDTLARGFAGSEWADTAAGGQIAVEGCFVLMALTEDPASVLEAARQCLK